MASGTTCSASGSFIETRFGERDRCRRSGLSLLLTGAAGVGAVGAGGGADEDDEDCCGGLPREGCSSLG